MFELTAAIGDLSTPVKVGWTLWFAWSVISLGWYRHARVPTPVVSTTPSRFIPEPADPLRESHQEDLSYSDPTGSSYRDSAGSPYGDSNGSSAPNY